jgi:hypothetical protein
VFLTLAAIFAARSAGAEAVATSTSGLFSDVRSEGEDGLDLHRLALDAPALALELGLSVVMPLVALDQRFAAGRRLYDLLTNDERTLALVPVLDPFDTRSSGIGVGGALFFVPIDVDLSVVFVGLGRPNGDHRISGRVRHALVRRELWIVLSGDREEDQDRRYHGTGAGTSAGAERRFSDESTRSRVGLEWTEDGIVVASSAGLARHSYGAGVDDDVPSVAAVDGPSPPPGFGGTFHVADARLVLGYATDPRPGRGLSFEAAATGARSFDGGAAFALRGETALEVHIPILRPDRVLSFQAYASAAGGGVPFPIYAFLGGPDRLRGYPAHRFAGRLAWWASAEYRYRIFEMPYTDVRASAFLFFEGGQAADRPLDLIDRPIPFSAGVGLRVETHATVLGRFQVGGSPEGVRFTAVIGGMP